MSDEISRDASGQFVATPAEPLTGKAGIEEAQGYKPLDLDDKPTEPSPISLEDALDDGLRPFENEGDDAGPRTPEGEIRTYGTFLDNLPDNVSLTIEDAAKITSEEKAAEAEALEEAKQELVRNEVDRIRGETEQAAERDVSPEMKVYLDAGVDRDVAEALIKPQVRTALEAEFTKADQSREQYTAGLENARVHALATLSEIVPHLSGLPPAQFEEGLAVLAQVDPQAFQKTMNVLGRVHTIVQHQQQAHQHQAQQHAAHFERYAAQEDRAFDAQTTREQKQQLDKHLAPYLQKVGININDFAHALRTNPQIRSAAAQKLIADAVAYDQMKNAQQPKPTRSIPPVQKPGTAQVRTRGTDNSSKIASLERALSSATGTQAARISGQLYTLQKKSRS